MTSAPRFMTKVSINSILDEPLVYHHDTVTQLKHELAILNAEQLIVNVYVEDRGRPLDGPETLRLILLG